MTTATPRAGGAQSSSQGGATQWIAATVAWAWVAVLVELVQIFEGAAVVNDSFLIEELVLFAPMSHARRRCTAVTAAHADTATFTTIDSTDRDLTFSESHTLRKCNRCSEMLELPGFPAENGGWRPDQI